MTTPVRPRVTATSITVGSILSALNSLYAVEFFCYSAPMHGARKLVVLPVSR